MARLLHAGWPNASSRGRDFEQDVIVVGACVYKSLMDPLLLLLDRFCFGGTPEGCDFIATYPNFADMRTGFNQYLKRAFRMSFVWMWCESF
jgi:hypothetical protein